MRRRSGTTQLNHLVARLAVHRIPLDFHYLFEGRPVREIDWRRPDAGARTPARLIPLWTAWPTLRMSDDALARLGPPNGTRNGTPSGGDGVLETSAQAVPAHAPAPVAAAAPRPGGPRGSCAAAPAPAALAAPVDAAIGSAPGIAAGNDAAAVLEDHMATMERFLEADREIMNAYLGATALAPADRAAARRGRPAGARARADRRAPGRPSGGSLPARSHARAHRLPHRPRAAWRSR